MPGRWLATWLALALLALALLAPAQLLAAPLTLKDDYRSPRNPERAVRKTTTLIVLHTTEAPAKSSLNKLSERGEAHYCVVEDGTVYRIVDRNREAFHAGRSMWNGKEDCDEYTIGIEVVGYHNKAVTLQQIAALKELVARLKRMYNITDGRVVCHSHIAYGAPNTWHKKKHRGRKRCGMLFAMPSVRAKLGLTARPAYDPDVKAKRLVQADPDLAASLYGTRDTMAAHYNRRPAPVVMRVAPAKPQTAKTTPPQTAKTPPPQTAKTTPPKVAPQPPKPVPAKPTIIVKQLPPVVKPAQPVVKQPPPIVKPARPIVKQPPPIVKPAQPKQMELPQAEGDSGMLAEIGGFFKSTAKLIVPKKKKPPAPAVTNASSQIIVVGRKLERPSQVLSRDPRDLAALEAMPGYEKGGPVSAELTPFRIAGPAWRAPTTYYYMNGRIVTGDKVNERLVEKGAYIFYRK